MLQFKKICTWVLAGALAFSVAGCQPQTQPQAQNEEPTAEQERFGAFIEKEFVDTMESDYTTAHVYLQDPESFGVDPDKISVILEAMAGKSHDTLLKAYYDVTLKRKNSRDDESAEMLDIIFGNRMYMFDMVFDWGGIKNSIIESVNESRNDMKTIEANLGEQIKNEIAATMKAVRENN